MELNRLNSSDTIDRESINENVSKNIPKLSLLFIFATTVFMWGSGSFSYDFPQIFEPILITNFQISTFEVSYLYTSIAIASILVMPLGSFVISKTGLGLAALIFNFLIFIGTLIIYYGTNNKNFKYVFIGRMIYGIGCEPAFMCQNIAYEKWFSGRYLTIAYGLNRFFMYGFFVLDIYLQPKLFLDTRSLTTPVFIYGIFGAISCFTSVWYFYLEYQNEDKLEHLKDIENMMKREEEGDNTKYVATEQLLQKEIGIDEEKEKDTETKDFKDLSFKFKDLNKVSSLSWILVAIICIMAQVNIQMTNFATDMLVMRYGLDYIEAKNTNMIVYSTSMILIPLASIFLGVKGKRGFFLILAGVVCVVTMIFMMKLTLGCERYKAYIAMFGIGIYWSLYTATVWTSLMLSLPKQAVSTMISITLTLQNSVFAALPPLFAMINQERKAKSYQKSLEILTGIAVLSLSLCVLAYLVDLKSHQVMELPENSEKALSRRRKMTQEFTESKYGSMTVTTKTKQFSVLNTDDEGVLRG